MNPTTAIRLARLHGQQMHDHVVNLLPEEACGLLAGLGGESRQFFPVTNQLHSPRRFYMEPLQLLGALQTMDELGLELIAVMHSHPEGPLHPSSTDLREYLYPETPAIIWGPVGLPLSPGYDCFVYQIKGDHFDPVRLEIY